MLAVTTSDSVHRYWGGGNSDGQGRGQEATGDLGVEERQPETLEPSLEHLDRGSGDRREEHHDPVTSQQQRDAGGGDGPAHRDRPAGRRVAGGGELQDLCGRLFPGDLLVDELRHEMVDGREVGVVALTVRDLAPLHDDVVVDAGLVAQGERRERDVDEDVAQSEELRDRRHRGRDVGGAGTVRQQHLAHAQGEVE